MLDTQHLLQKTATGEDARMSRPLASNSRKEEGFGLRSLPTIDAVRVERSEAARPALWRQPAGPPVPTTPKVYRIAVSGGPCAGKTSLIRRLLDEGVPSTTKIAVVPELATLAMENGLRFESLASPSQVRRVHTGFLGALIAIEDLMYTYMSDSACKNAALICDRGALDASAFCDADTWQHVLADHHATDSILCEQRYDCVVFMRSIAVDLPQQYSHDTNAMRRESAAEAAELDHRLLKIWSRHPRLIVVDNDYPSFEAKLDASVAKIDEYLSMQTRLLDFS